MPVIKVPSDYTSMQSAVNAALPGDEIHVGNGVYAEQVTIDNKCSITIMAVGNNVILDGSSFTPPTIGFKLVNAAYVKITGFTTKNFDKGIIVNNPSNNIVINGNTIRDIRDDGIKIKGDYCTLINNNISNCKDDAVKVLANNCSVTDNYIYNNREEGIEINGDSNTVKQNNIINNLRIGIEITGKDNTVTDNIMNNNGISDVVDSGTNNFILNTRQS